MAIYHETQLCLVGKNTFVFPACFVTVFRKAVTKHAGNANVFLWFFPSQEIHCESHVSHLLEALASCGVHAGLSVGGWSTAMVCFPQCINREARAANFSSSLNLPDKTLQFVKDHPLMDDSVTPIDNRPRLIKSDVSYTQIVVDRTQALDGTVYEVMFVGTGGSRNSLGKSS